MPPAEHAATRGPFSEQRVLIVDDDPDMAEVLTVILEEEGFRTRAALSPHSAMALASSFAPTVAILDIGLPEIDGYELLTKLREEPALAGCKFIAMTGNSDPALRERSSSVGFSGHLLKPFSMPDLLAFVVSVSTGELDT